MTTTEATTPLGEILSRAQSDTLNGLSLIEAITAGRLYRVARDLYSVVQVGDPIPGRDVIDFIAHFAVDFPGEVDSLVRYAALRDAHAEGVR